MAKVLTGAGVRAVMDFSSNEEAVNRVVMELQQNGGEATPVRTTLSREDQVSKMVERILREYGTIGILVNNARVPYNRVGEPKDGGATAISLASDGPDYVNGTTIIVDGGMLLYPGFASGG
ncbi:MAG: SDR family oxidoreductase [Proteobacteria bacterium]|nr:SDR family oxidoreductase [Pseudomonadota bacterium]